MTKNTNTFEWTLSLTFTVLNIDPEYLAHKDSIKIMWRFLRVLTLGSDWLVLLLTQFGLCYRDGRTIPSYRIMSYIRQFLGSRCHIFQSSFQYLYKTIKTIFSSILKVVTSKLAWLMGETISGGWKRSLIDLISPSNCFSLHKLCMGFNSPQQ